MSKAGETRRIPGRHAGRLARGSAARGQRQRIVSILFAFLLAGVAAYLPAPSHALAPNGFPGATTLNAEELIELAGRLDDLIVIDSRKLFDWERGRIDGAIHLVNTEMTKEKLATIASRDQAVVFYCNGPECPRSGDATAKAVKWGWTKIYWFRGGISEWTNKNYPLTK